MIIAVLDFKYVKVRHEDFKISWMNAGSILHSHACWFLFKTHRKYLYIAWRVKIFDIFIHKENWFVSDMKVNNHKQVKCPFKRNYSKLCETIR